MFTTFSSRVLSILPKESCPTSSCLAAEYDAPLFVDDDGAPQPMDSSNPGWVTTTSAPGAPSALPATVGSSSDAESASTTGVGGTDKTATGGTTTSATMESGMVSSTSAPSTGGAVSTTTSSANSPTSAATKPDPVASSPLSTSANSLQGGAATPGTPAADYALKSEYYCTGVRRLCH